MAALTRKGENVKAPVLDVIVNKQNPRKRKVSNEVIQNEIMNMTRLRLQPPLLIQRLLLLLLLRSFHTHINNTYTTIIHIHKGAVLSGH